VGSAFATVQQSLVQFKSMAKRMTRRQRGSVIPPPSNDDLDSVRRNCLTSETQREVRSLPDGSSATDMTDHNAGAESLVVSDEVSITAAAPFTVDILSSCQVLYHVLNY